MRLPTWLRGNRVPALDEDDGDGALRSGPAADAAFLLATYEPELWDGCVVGAGTAAARDELPGGDLVVARGDYHRWMQDARGWAKNGLRAWKKSADPYREQKLVDEDLRRAARAVLSAVTDDSNHAVVLALSDYVNRARAWSTFACPSAIRTVDLVASERGRR